MRTNSRRANTNSVKTLSFACVIFLCLFFFLVLYPLSLDVAVYVCNICKKKLYQMIIGFNKSVFFCFCLPCKPIFCACVYECHLFFFSL